MPIYDNNGSANTEIGKIYDNNGSVNTEIKEVYDNNGSVNSLIFSGETNLGNIGFGNCSRDYRMINGGGIASWTNDAVKFAAAGSGAFGGSIIWTNQAVSCTSGGTLNYYSGGLSTQTVDTNMAPGTWHGGSIYFVFADSQISIAYHTTARDHLINNGASLVEARSAWMGYYNDCVCYGNAPAGTFSITVPVSGNKFIGVFLYGYNFRTTSTTTISNMIIR